MFSYITFILMGAWQGSLSLLLCVLGTILMTLPYLVQPVLGYKFRNIISSLMLAAGCFGVFYTITLAHKEITADKYIQIQQLAASSSLASIIWSEHKQNNQLITNLDYFQLGRHIVQRNHI